MDNVTIDDEKRTLSIKLSSPDSDIPAALTSPVFSPVPTNVPNDASWGSTMMIGNGPYKLDAPFKAKETLKVVRNTNYAGDGEGKQPYLDAIEFHSFDDVDSAYKEFAAGKGDLALFPESAAADLQKFQQSNIVAEPTLAIEGFGFNMASDIVGGPENLKLRQAIAAATNKAQINAEAFAGTHEVASQFTPSAVPGAEPSSTDGKPDVEKAKQLLKDWGKTPPELKVSFPDGSPPKLVDVMVDSLINVGLPAVKDIVPTDPFFENVGKGEYDMFVFGWTADYPTYRAFLQPMFASQNIGTQNLFNYNNPEVDGLFDEALKSSSVDDSNKSYREAEKKILADQPYVPIDWSKSNFIKNAYVNDVTINPLGLVDYTTVWLSPKPTP